MARVLHALMPFLSRTSPQGLMNEIKQGTGVPLSYDYGNYNQQVNPYNNPPPPPPPPSTSVRQGAGSPLGDTYTGTTSNSATSSNTGNSGNNSGLSLLTESFTNQNGHGDCTLISSLNELVQQNPGYLQSHVTATGSTPTGGQGFDVKLYENASWTTYHVDTKDIPSSAAHDLDGNVNLGSIYENAFAQAHGGYDVIDSGAWGGSTLTELVGPGVSQSYLNSESRERADVALSTVAAGGLALAETEQQPGTITTAQSYDPKTGEIVSPSTPGAITLGDNHCYAILAVSGDSGNRTVTVGDPYYSAPANPGNWTLGTFTVSEDALKKIFPLYTTYGGLNTSHPTSRG